MIDRRDKCEPLQGELYPGGYAMIHPGGGVSLMPSLEGKCVLLVEMDEHGYWDTFDIKGDLLIIHPSNLMPISDQGFDDGSNNIERWIYEARFGM